MTGQPPPERPPRPLFRVARHDRYPRVIEVEDEEGARWFYYLAPDRTPLAGYPFIAMAPGGAVVHLFLPYGPGAIPVVLEVEGRAP